MRIPMGRWPTPVEIDADTAKWLALLHAVSDLSWFGPRAPRSKSRDPRQRLK